MARAKSCKTVSHMHTADLNIRMHLRIRLIQVTTCCVACPPAAKVESVESGAEQSPAGSESNFGKRTMVDGGMVANNPTLHALTWMNEHLGCKPQDVAVLSLGTGLAVVDASTAGKSGGKWHWKSDAVAVLMGSAAEAMDAVIDNFYYQVRAVLELVFAISTPFQP